MTIAFTVAFSLLAAYWIASVLYILTLRRGCHEQAIKEMKEDGVYDEESDNWLAAVIVLAVSVLIAPVLFAGDLLEYFRGGEG